jgi:hypothetical protein
MYLAMTSDDACLWLKDPRLCGRRPRSREKMTEKSVGQVVAKRKGKSRHRAPARRTLAIAGAVVYHAAAPVPGAARTIVIRVRQPPGRPMKTS